MSSFIPFNLETLNLKFLPTDDIPIEDTVKTSPTEYPVPPFEIVAAIAIPLFIVIFAVAFLPKLSTLLNVRLLKVKDPDDGVYPIPLLIIVRSPFAVPAVPTRLPSAPEVN